MDYFDFERMARENEVKIWEYSSPSDNGFWANVYQRYTEDKTFFLEVTANFRLQATGVVAEILEKITKTERKYFISGALVISNGLIEIPLLSEISRPKPSGILFEKLVDVEFLVEMQKTRRIDMELQDQIKNERYYVKACLVNATEDARNNMYKGCQHPDCHGAKVIPKFIDGNLVFQCTKCFAVNPGYDDRVMPKLDLVDPKESLNATAQKVTAAIFKRNAEVLFQMIEKEIAWILEAHGEKHFADMFNRRYGITAVLRLRAEVFQGKISYSVDEIFVNESLPEQI